MPTRPSTACAPQLPMLPRARHVPQPGVSVRGAPVRCYFLGKTKVKCNQRDDMWVDSTGLIISLVPQGARHVYQGVCCTHFPSRFMTNHTGGNGTAFRLCFHCFLWSVQEHVYNITVPATCLPHTGFAGVWTLATHAELICHRTIHKHGSKRTSGFDSPHRATP